MMVLLAVEWVSVMCNCGMAITSRIKIATRAMVRFGEYSTVAPSTWIMRPMVGQSRNSTLMSHSDGVWTHKSGGQVVFWMGSDTIDGGGGGCGDDGSNLGFLEFILDEALLILMGSAG